MQKEADEAKLQWVNQMTSLSRITMPFKRKFANLVVALVAVALAVGSFWSPAVADPPLPLLQ